MKMIQRQAALEGIRRMSDAYNVVYYLVRFRDMLPIWTGPTMVKRDLTPEESKERADSLFSEMSKHDEIMLLVSLVGVHVIWDPRKKVGVSTTMPITNMPLPGIVCLQYAEILKKGEFGGMYTPDPTGMKELKRFTREGEAEEYMKYIEENKEMVPPGIHFILTRDYAIPVVNLRSEPSSPGQPQTNDNPPDHAMA